MVGVSLHANLFIVLRGQFPKLVLRCPGSRDPKGQQGSGWGIQAESYEADNGNEFYFLLY